MNRQHFLKVCLPIALCLSNFTALWTFARVNNMAIAGNTLEQKALKRTASVNPAPAGENGKLQTAKPRVLEVLPGGYRRINARSGVVIYQKGEDFIVSVDYSQGASLKLFAGDIASPGQNSSTYGGKTPEFKRISAGEALQMIRRTTPAAYCAFNGQFFADFPRDTAQLAYPLRLTGRIVSDGFAPKAQNQGGKLMLELFSSTANIRPFSIEQLRSSPAPEVLVSLSHRVDREANSKVGRTFVGLAQPSSEKQYKLVYVFVSRAATQEHAYLSLRRLGASQVIMLDGGKSTQLQCGNSKYVSFGRPVPQFIVAVTANS